MPISDLGRKAIDRARSPVPRPPLGTGLDLSRPDSTPVEEWIAWREQDISYRGVVMPTYEVLGELGRFDAVKRWLAQIPHFRNPEGGFTSPMNFLHLYALWGFELGMIYEIANCEREGHRKAEVAEMFALAFMHSPSGTGLTYLADMIRERMALYKEREEPMRYPDNWAPDLEFFDCGLDFSTPEMKDGELAKIEDWYERVTGEIPRHVRFLGKHRPNLLKAYRNRFEHTMRVMPKQMMPWLWMHWEAVRGHEEGIREAVLLAKGFGVSKGDAVTALCWAMLYGAHGCMANVDRAVGDILDADW